MIKALSFAAVGLLMGGCALFSGPAGQDALKGAQAAITTYVDVYQPAILAYGQLPVCGSAPVVVLCHDKAVYAKLKAVDLAATKSIVAAQAVIEGSTSDTGTEISDALSAISAAERAIASEGIVK